MKARTFTFYCCKTGVFRANKFRTTDLGQLKHNIPEGCEYIEGEFDHHCEKVDLTTGNVVPYIPPQPDDQHHWTGKRWVLKPEVVEENNARIAAKAAIADLENKQHRAVREFILAENEKDARAAKDRVRALEAQMAVHRDSFREKFKRNL